VTADQSRLPPTAPLSQSLLARKGGATADGFADAPPLVEPPAIEGPSVGVRAAPRILIVEDNALNLKMMTDLFEGHGYRALPAVNGPQALVIAQAERPDLIVMDIELPGLSGLSVARRLKADSGLGAVPVIAVSARAGPETAATAREAGCDAYLAKPVSVADMLAAVARFLP